MEATPELLAKLAQRRRRIDGVDLQASVGSDGRASSGGGPHGAGHPLGAGGAGGRHASGAAGSRAAALAAAFACGESSGDSPPEATKSRSLRYSGRKVQVPEWVVDVDPAAAPLQPPSPAPKRLWVPGVPPWFSTAVGLGRGGAAATSSAPAAGAAGRSPAARHDLQARLASVELERESARREAAATKAGAEARYADLGAEAGRLRASAAELRRQLEEARAEVAGFTGGGANGSRVATAPTSLAGVPDLAAENRALTAELCEAAELRRELKVRLQGLGTESQRQEESCSAIEGKLAASRARRRALLRRLQSLGRDTAVQEDEEGIDFDEPGSLAEDIDAGTGGDLSLSLDGISLANSSALGADAPPHSPSSAHFYELRNGAYASHSSAEVTMESSGAMEGGYQADDLEFAYDWGLGLAGKMSIPRALELARWAAAQCRSADSGKSAASEAHPQNGTVLHDDAIEDSVGSADGQAAPFPEDHGEEGRFEAPLLELQDALAMLQRGAQRSRSSSDDAAGAPSEFDGPVADLQKALSLLGRPPLAPAAAPAREPAAAEEESPGSFAGPIADLQHALARLRGPGPPAELADASPIAREPSLDADGGDGPLAELQAALTRLQGSSSSAAGPAEGGGGGGAAEGPGGGEEEAEGEGTPESGRPPPPPQPREDAAAGGGGAPPGGGASPSAAAEQPAPVAAAAAMLLGGPLGAPWGSAQALIRQKYISTAGAAPGGFAAAEARGPAAAPGG